ncbi:MAG: polyphosphate--glucose phosphotransferase [Calditrichia bacterium]
MKVLGVDVGGSGIKGAIVDTNTGVLLEERFRLDTPQPAHPDVVAETVNKVVKHFDWKGPVGCGFPAVVRNGLVKTASNISKKWINVSAEKLFSKTTGCEVRVMNDADVAGLAEMKFGAGKGNMGSIVMITIGTGLGSALFRNGILFPNTEFGHFKLKGDIAEHYAANSVRKKEDLSWKKWGKRFNHYLEEVELLVAPDLIILGGGASKKIDRFEDEIEIETEVVTATLLNEAGIVGAALSIL